MNNSFIQEAFRQIYLTEDAEELSLDAMNPDNTESFLDMVNNAEDDEMISDVYDLEAEAKEDLKQSYIGKVILDCNVCHSNVFFDKEEITEDEDGICCADIECPYCMSNEGYTIIGEVKPYQEAEDVDIEDIETEEVPEEELEVEEEAPEEETIEDEEDLEEGLKADEVKELRGDEEINGADGPLKAVDELEGSDEIRGPKYTELNEGCEEKDELIESKTPWVIESDVDGEIARVKSEAEAKNTIAQLKREDKKLRKGEKVNYTYKLDESLEEEGLLEGCDGCEEEVEEGLTGTVAGKVAGKAIGTAVGGPVGGAVGSFVGGKIGDKVQDTFSEGCEEKDELNEESLTESLNLEDLVPGKVYSHKRSIPYMSKADAEEYPEDFEQVKDILVLFNGTYRLPGPNEMTYVGREERELDWNPTLVFDVMSTEISFDRDILNYLEPVDEELHESIEDVSINTEDENITMTTKEDGGVVVETSPVEEIEEEPIELSGEEMIAPVEPETEEDVETAIETNGEEEVPEDEMFEEEPLEGEEEFVEEPMEDEFEEFDEESFDELGESYLKRCYENVTSFKTSSISLNEDKSFLIEGKIGFDSGNEKNTQFIFNPKTNEDGKLKLEGYNKQISNGKKTFKLNCSVNDKKVVCESLNYNYKGKNDLNESVRVYGTVKRK